MTLVPHITLIRPNTLSLKGAITLFWVNTKRKTVMTLIRIVLLSNGCAVITLFRINLKRVKVKSDLDPMAKKHPAYSSHEKTVLGKNLDRIKTR